MSKKALQIKSEKRFLSKCFTNLEELPIYNWWKLNDTGDISYLLRDKRSVTKNEQKILNKIWYGLVNDFAKTFGYSEQFEEILQKKRELHGRYVEIIVTEDKTVKTFINILEQEIKELEGQLAAKTTNHWELKAAVDERLKFQVNVHVCSVMEYMHYIKRIEEAA